MTWNNSWGQRRHDHIVTYVQSKNDLWDIRQSLLRSSKLQSSWYSVCSEQKPQLKFRYQQGPEVGLRIYYLLYITSPAPARSSYTETGKRDGTIWETCPVSFQNACKPWPSRHKSFPRSILVQSLLVMYSFCPCKTFPNTLLLCRLGNVGKHTQTYILKFCFQAAHQALAINLLGS